MSEYVLSYTRKPIDSVLYDARLAYSMHLALSDDGQNYRGLNHNSGVLFALATENEDGSLNPMSLKNPFLFTMKDGSFGVVAVRILADGDDDSSSKGSVLLWTSDDLLIYKEEGLLALCDCFIDSISCVYDKTMDTYRLCWTNANGGGYYLETKSLMPIDKNAVVKETSERPLQNTLENICTADMEGAVLYNKIEITDVQAARLKKKLLTPENTGISFPETITVKSEQELANYPAETSYSDGTSLKRMVDWDLSGVDFDKDGEYQIHGCVRQEHFPFPVAFNRADPCVTRWHGKYYFIATNDADDNHTLYMRESDSITGLVDAEEHLILDSSTYEGIGGLLWAPEFHEINGKLYIFHAATPKEFFWEESCIMELREGGNPICREDWSAPRRIVKRDGSDLCEAGKTISLDMTCFFWEEKWYVIWSQRQFLPKDLGAWLYIAELNPHEPWKLAGEPVILSKPDYGWGNNHTFVEEGPYALVSNGTLYITFSAAAVDTSYVVSYLTIEAGKDLLKPENWRKNNYPILTSRSVEGEYGTGHNAYVTDENGIVWNTYHARPGTDGVRSSGIRRVHFDTDGAPVLDVTEELDLKKEFRNLETKLIISR